MNQDRDGIEFIQHDKDTLEVKAPNPHPKPGFRIKTLWAYAIVNPEDDEEGIPAFMCEMIPGEEVFMPMVAADRKRIDALRTAAVRAGKAQGVPVRLLRFKFETVEEVIEP